MADDKKSIEYLAREGEGPMSEKDFESVVSLALSECVQFVDGTLSPDRAKATEYYNGKPFGNEEEGRSQVVLTEVRDAVDGMIPSLMRVFFGSEHTVEFVPTRADNVAQAEQKTDYVRYVFEEDNAGFLQTLSVLKDGLVRKIGIFKWWWDKSEETQAYKQEGVDQEQLRALASDDAIEFTNIEQRKDGLFDVDFTRTEEDGRVRVASVPPEEFIYNRQARNLDGALVIAHRMDKTEGELLAMGIKAVDIKEHGNSGATDASLSGNQEEIARRDTAGVGKSPNAGTSNDPPLGKANDRILYTEALMNVDKNGDGKAELLCVHTIGPNFYPVKDYPSTSDKGFSVFTPYPEPHALLGGSVSDRTSDIQKINSAIMRAILDSGAAAAFPRTAYKEGSVAVSDIMNTAIGAPVRVRGDVANDIRELVTPFTGKELLPVLQFMQEVIERRTGRNKGAAGLDADALQSTGKEAVGAVLSGGQEQIELIARIFAEMTLKPLFKGIGRLLQDKQPRKRVVRLRGAWTEVDPRSWDSNMDVTVNVALGTTFTEKKIATLMAVAADQENMIEKLGLANPATSLPKLLQSRAKILSLQGIKDFESYYNKLPPDWQPPAPPAPEPDPSVLAMQAEAEMSHMKAMKELAIKADEMKLKLAEHDMKRDEMQDKREQAVLDQKNAEFEQSFKLEELAINTELKRLEIEATIAAQQASAEMASSEGEAKAGSDAAMKEVREGLMALASREPTINVHPPQVNVAAAPAPNVNIAPAEVTVNHSAPSEAPKKKKRKGSITGPDGKKYTVESEGD